MKGQLEETRQDLETLKYKYSICENIILNKQTEITELQDSIHGKESTARKLIQEKKVLTENLASHEAELAKIRGSNYYKRLCRKEVELQKFERVVEQHSAGGCDTQISDLCHKVKNLQTVISGQKKTIEDLRSTQKTLRAAVTPLQIEIDDYAATIEDLKAEKQTIVLKVGKKFSDDVVKCIIQLVGECNVPSIRCAKTIQCISKCLFHHDIDIIDLPSERSNLRMVDRGHVLAKYHIAESIIKSDGVDYHTDATTRDHRKYLGTQVTLSSGNVLSIGYSMVMTEDTQTLLDAAIAVLQELADVYAADTVEENFKRILHKLNGLMSDRASVNKSFNKAMNKKRCDILGDESLQLEFIYCRAHFLLGLSSESEKAMKVIQKEINGGKLGRDKLPKFKNWTSGGESAVARYIRTACDVLGPRGDDKSGCRDAWEAYCSLKEVSSLIKSYRSNRFNNYFEGAASLHYHRKDIEEFFSNYASTPNLKLQSVLADCQSNEIDILLSAIGIAYFVLTGPYWLLITSSTQYLDLYKYLTPMREKMVENAEDASGLLENPSSLIPGFSVDGKDVLPRLLEVTSQEQLRDSLQTLFKGFVAVTDRQLTDFLPGGQYHDVQDPERRQKMKHTQLTNLIGEACLGDLDYSMFVKRHASLHYRSFTSMMARNQTMSSWFHDRSEEEQTSLLAMSAAKSQPLREKHRDAEKAVVVQRKQHLVMTRELLEKKREKALQHKTALSKKVKEHGGPCTSPADVDQLVQRFTTKTATKTAVNDEIQYQKVVLGSKSKLLKSSKLTVDQMVKNLKDYLDDDETGTMQGQEDTGKSICPLEGLYYM